jgi:hypothetical protein
VQSLHNVNEGPALVDATDDRPLGLAVRFTTTTSGTLTAVRWFKSPQEGGSGHVGKIYDFASRAQLAVTPALSDAQCPGPVWVRLPLSTPLRATPGQEYVVAVEGLMYYVKSEGFWSAPRQSGNLLARQAGALYTFAVGGMPDQVALGGTTNYFVDGEWMNQREPWRFLCMLLFTTQPH